MPEVRQHRATHCQPQTNGAKNLHQPEPESDTKNLPAKEDNARSPEMREETGARLATAWNKANELGNRMRVFVPTITYSGEQPVGMFCIGNEKLMCEV